MKQSMKHEYSYFVVNTIIYSETLSVHEYAEYIGAWLEKL